MEGALNLLRIWPPRVAVEEAKMAVIGAAVAGVAALAVDIREDAAMATVALPRASFANSMARIGTLSSNASRGMMLLS
jgi:hypothetical protein